MTLPDYRGARGSNTGDAFHELWATRQAIRLLSNEEGLQAVAVEGLVSTDESDSARDTWNGVDCTQYFGGRDAANADRIRIEQLKYSAANPGTPWTIARLIEGRRGRSIIGRLAKAWKALDERRSATSSVCVVLVSNQPVPSEVNSALERAAESPIDVPDRKPDSKATPEVRLAYATGLSAEEFHAFASAFRVDAGAGSRFALEERVLCAIADWTDQDLQSVVTGLREFVRRQMLPEAAGEAIMRESVLLHLGVSEEQALFPCPSEIVPVKSPISRSAIREAANALCSGSQYLCLHGSAGVGKTTALQEIEAALPEGSVMVRYDCYGGGRYLDPDALRHRPRDAFLHLTNELAVRLALPLMLSPRRDSDYPRVFANCLRHAACALASRHPDASLVIAVDAADNAIFAAGNREPAELSFVHDFLKMTAQPNNVRFVVTARTGRLYMLRLPRKWCTTEVLPFSRNETAENVAKWWAAEDAWVDDFHHLSGGVPRIQGYAFDVDGAHPSTALDRLRPAGKLLADIFQQQFQRALTNSGVDAELARLCAALIVLPRPIPLADLAAILNTNEAQLADICADLAPGIRLQDKTVGFADEDFEEFVRAEGEAEIASVRASAAEWLLSCAGDNRYAALHVAAVLVDAGRGAELLKLVEQEPAPTSIIEPILRREAELQRRRLAIRVCREAGDVAHALRFVLSGAEGVKTETALRRLLIENPDLAVRFAPETVRRLILSDRDQIEYHGSMLFHKLSFDADKGDAISVREGWRFLQAWMKARELQLQDAETHHHGAWQISLGDISSTVEAVLKLHGLEASLKQLRSWRSKHIALEIALTLPYRLIAEGNGDDLEAFVASGYLKPFESFFLLVPLALAGRTVDVQGMARGLDQLWRRKLRIEHFFQSSFDRASFHAKVLDTVLSACEILTAKRVAAELVDEILADFLAPALRRIDKLYPSQEVKLDLLFRAYSLREARAGRRPDAETVFEPRPTPVDERERPRHGLLVDPHDYRMMELARAVFVVYATVANALVNNSDDIELPEKLCHAARISESTGSHSSRDGDGRALCRHASAHALVLLATDHHHQAVKRFAMNVHEQWGCGDRVPERRFAARSSLWQPLQSSLLAGLFRAVSSAKTMRIGADKKSTALIDYARIMRPLSEKDAQATFNSAVEIAGDLDHEIVAQLWLIDELVRRGSNCFDDPRATARRLSNVIADAAVRLGGFDHFPWNHAMAALTRLDVPLALANAARWDDEELALLCQILPTVLITALREKAMRLEQAAALTLLADDSGGVMGEILSRANQSDSPGLSALVEEAAWDVLIRHGDGARAEALYCIERKRLTGRWSSLLLIEQECKSAMIEGSSASEEESPQADTETPEPAMAAVWTREILINSSLLHTAVVDQWRRLRTERGHYDINAVFESARRSVSPGDRVDHITALAGVDVQLVGFDEEIVARQAAAAMLWAIDQWRNSPSVQEWCRKELPKVFVKRFPEMIRSLGINEDNLACRLKRMGLSGGAVQNLLLRGLERHGDTLEVGVLFRLAGRVGGMLPPAKAASLADWYIKRLEERIPSEHRNHPTPEPALPQCVDEAVARLVFAFMGDCDLRMRWRAAHAVRRLARTGDQATLVALAGEYPRREEPIFRGSGFEFYWLAARLWFVLAWDRMADERPELAACAGRRLLEIALDDCFPHLLIRSFARDACEKLAATGHLSLTPVERSRLACVGETPMPRASADPRASRTIDFGHLNGISSQDKAPRFEFNEIDTLRYWYEPMLQVFAAVDGQRFLAEAERCIIDVWGYDGQIRDAREEVRPERFFGRNFRLSMNSHGSIPTIEPLRTHLEWHAMWCAAGELLKSEPLALPDGYGSGELSSWIARAKLAEPPLWPADLRVPIPPLARNWQSGQPPLEDWITRVREADHRAQLFPNDSPRYMVVEGWCERRARDRTESIHISSALVGPNAGRALLRALQTMSDSWDYKLPHECEEAAEIDTPPYRFLGWLWYSHEHEGVDQKDPFRGYASDISSRPGRRVTAFGGLTRDAAGRPRWFGHGAEQPMFVYEAWGEAAGEDTGYPVDYGVRGHRLLAHREQVLSFLRHEELDLIVEVEVTRGERTDRRYTGEEANEARQGRFARLYLLDGDGSLEVAEGCLGAWTGDCREP